MYKQKKKDIKNNGITLIALVVTMVIITILAAIVITISTTDNGLVQKANQSKETQAISQEKATIMAAYSGVIVAKKGKFDKAEFREELEKQKVELDTKEPDKGIKFLNDNPIKIEVTTKLATYMIEQGTITMLHLNQGETQTPTVPTELQVGDTIIYDPTKGVLDQSKLTYTSKKGTPKTGGNGHGTQIVTSKSTNNEWIVISKANNQIKVISKDIIGDDENKFLLNEGTGYLYAEEEVHKACSVFGHGKGAKKITTTYQIGNYQVPGEAQTKTITGSGARSITMEDIVKIMKGNDYTKFTESEKKRLDVNYHTTISSEETTYPTITSDDWSGLRQKFQKDYFSIHKDKYDEELVTDQIVKENKNKLKEIIYKNGYLIASRSIYVDDTSVIWGCYMLMNNRLEQLSLDWRYLGIAGGIGTSTPKVALRPVVYLDKNMIERTNDGVWKIKD
ncbi:MAG: type II secretion system protein [Clostridium sp.]